jgi:DNA-binding response OmpR family regulator/anti-sigma regulatory factor (Ser/Thr protein kinase)
MKLFEAARPATLEDVSWLRNAMRRELENLRMVAGLVDDLQLVVSEIATNMVVHAATAPRTLGLKIDLHGFKLRIEISDDGSPFADFEAMWSEAGRKELIANDTHGLGMALVSGILQNVTYEPGKLGARGKPGKPNRLVGWRSLASMRPSILIVEDDPTLLKLYGLFLKQRYNVFVATSIEEAIAITSTQMIDLILSDYHIGEDVGTNLFKELERDPERLPIPVIMMTGDRDLDKRRQIENFGIDRFLQKPLMPAVLRAEVEQTLLTSNRRLAGMFRYFGAGVDCLLTPPPQRQLHNSGIAHRFGNATSGGGDFLLHFRTREYDRVVLTDVMGHGLKAKAAAIAFAAAMRVVQIMAVGGPGDYLAALSKVLRRDVALSDLLATVIVVDRLRDGTVEIASAAHPAPFLVSKRDVRTLDVSGPILGLLVAPEYVPLRLTLKAGQRIALVTDGIEPMWIAGGGGLPESFATCLKDGCVEPLDAAIHRAGQWALTTLGPRPDDDWTVMLLESLEFQPRRP